MRPVRFLVDVPSMMTRKVVLTVWTPTGGVLQTIGLENCKTYM